MRSAICFRPDPSVLCCQAGQDKTPRRTLTPYHACLLLTTYSLLKPCVPNTPHPHPCQPPCVVACVRACVRACACVRARALV